ncbi:MAG: amidohydrolase family protein [Candidatus Zixiibacteriota bacterium]|nr:MAG: amidohydrolase family protein [candidate division Zixibacteria bacterium]
MLKTKLALTTYFLLLPIMAAVASEPILIKDGTVITVTGGTIEKGDVLLKDGKIEKVGKDITPPKNCMVIDATGKFIMPGIIDAHSHIGVYSWPGVEAHEDGNEMTDPITPQVRAEDSFNSEDPAILRAVAGGVTAIQTLPGSANLIGGQTVTLKLRPGRSIEEMKIKGIQPGMKMALGENPKRIYGKRNKIPLTRMGNIAMMREWFIKGKEYGEEWKLYERKSKKDKDEEVPERDLRLEALRDIVDGKYLVHVHSYTKDEMLKMIEIADEFGFQIRSFEHTLEGYKIADTLASRNIAACTWTDWWGFKVEAWEGIPHSPGLMASKGVRVVFHSDSPDQIQRLWLDAAKAVRYGMDRQKAFEALTINPAWAIGIDHLTGSIEEGKDADIAIFSGHPFNIYTLVEMTIVDGEIVFDRSKEPSPLEAPYED